MMKDTATPQPVRLAPLRKEIQESLLAHVDRAYKTKIRELVSTRGAVIGVRVPEIKALVKTFQSRHRDLTVDAACQLLDELCRDRGREEMLFGIFLLTRFRRQLSPSVWRRIDRWIDYMDNWETCDQLAMNIAGEMVARDLAFVDHLVAWAKSSNPWRRRFAVATTTVLNQKGRSHPEETFRVCQSLMADADPVVQKAVAWAIREVSKKNEPAAFAFLKQSKNRSHPRVFREASQKLSPGHQAALLGP